MKKWLDNYGKQENYNDSAVSLPEGFVGMGNNTKGRNYSPAWGGQFAMGGSLPGAVGHMYARIGAPSNGPKGKKTIASAENGKEMQYYQEGLDWQPKTISRNGDVINAQNGTFEEITGIKPVMTTMPVAKSDATRVDKQPLGLNWSIGNTTSPDVVKYNKLKEDNPWGDPYKFLMEWYNNPEIKKRLNSQSAPESPMTESLNQKLYNNYLDWYFAQKEKNKKIAESIYTNDSKEAHKFTNELNKFSEGRYEDLSNTTSGFHTPMDSSVALNSTIDRTKEEMENTAVHELTHATPLDNFYVDYFNKFKPKKPIGTEATYFSEHPEEIYPRIQDLRYQMWRDKKIKPGTKITPKLLEDYNNHSGENLRNYYSPEELSTIMNLVAVNKSNNTISTAKQGGWLDSYNVPKAQDGIFKGFSEEDKKKAQESAIRSRYNTGYVSQDKHLPTISEMEDKKAQSIRKPFVSPGNIHSESTSLGTLDRNQIELSDELANKPKFYTFGNNKSQPQLTQGREQAPIETYLSNQKKAQYVQTHPNTVLGSDNEIVTKNQDRGFENQPLTPNAKRFDKGLDHIMKAIEATGTLAGVGQIGSNLTRLGANALETQIGRNALSKGLKNFTSRINPTLNMLDEAASYVQLDPIGIMGNKLNNKFYNPYTALNVSNNKVTGVKRNLTNSGIEAADLVVGDNNVKNIVSSANVYEDYFKNIQANDKRLQDLLASKTITYDNYLKQSDLYKEELQKGLELGEKLGHGTYGEVFELADNPSKVVKIGSPYGNEWTPELIESLKSIKQNANIAIPEQVEYFKIPSLYKYYGSQAKEVVTMPNLNKVGAQNLNLNKRDRYALFLKQARQLRDKGIKLDVENPENFYFNKEKGVFDIYDVNPGHINNPAAYMRYIKNKTQRRLLDDMMYKKGGVIKDNRGQWDHEGEVTRISGGNITMRPDPTTGKPLTQPLLGISDTGEEQMMYPGEDYEFKGAKYVTEYPKGKLPKKAKNGVNQQDEKTLEHIDQLTNFTNYNKPTKGGWLDKY